MSIKRQLSLALLVGVGSTLVGCKTPAGGGLAFWKSDDTTVASTAPDAGRQKYENLAKEFGGNGHKHAAGARITGRTLDDVVGHVTERAKTYL